jgi:hypothetical protein
MFVISYRVGEVYQKESEKTVRNCKDLYREGKEGTVVNRAAYEARRLKISCHKNTASGVYLAERERNLTSSRTKENL